MTTPTPTSPTPTTPPRALSLTIAAKIFGLAIFLLLLTIGLSTYLLVEALRTGQSVETLARLDAPLAHSIAEVDQFGLRRRIAFERVYGTLGSAQPDPAVLTEASANFDQFTAKLSAEYANAHRILDAYPKNAVGRDTVIEIRTLLDQLEADFPTITARQTEVMSLMRAGQLDKARQQMTILNDLLRTSQSQRAEILDKVGALSLSRADTAGQRQHQVLALSLAVTLCTVLLGLTIAYLISNRLTAPVRSLVSAVKSVQAGDLALRLPVNSTDELGLLTESFNFFIAELQSKEQIKKTFGQYVDPRVLEHVLGGQDKALARGGRSNMTIMFGDLAGFTSTSERLTPSLMVAVLNRHFALQASAIHEHRGIVDKFIGDAVMAFWGPPFTAESDHPSLACHAALKQIEALANLRKELPELTGLRKDPPTLDLRIGICTGDVVVGNIGSDSARSFTVIGDTVNLTSRIEGANRTYNTRILLGESTAHAVAEDFELREIDAVAVKGKQEPTRLYELLGPANQIPESTRRLRDQYSVALTLYRAQQWDQAQAAFLACLHLDPTDGPSQLFLSRIPHLRTQAPTPTWDGVWHMTDKGTQSQAA